MAILTTNNPLGINYQTGKFSGPVGEPLSQHFFDAAFAGHVNQNKIYKEAYHCNIVQMCGMAQWLDEFMGYDTDCYGAYTLLETYGDLNQVKIDTNATVPQYPGTVNLHVDANSVFVNKQFILPQVGNSLVAPPNGTLIKVTAVSFASADDVVITVQQRDTTGNTAAFNIVAGDVLYVLTGSEIEDCECPTGQFRFRDMPKEQDLRMIEFGDKGELCGEALHKCQWLKIPFYDDCGNVITESWYAPALQQMYKDHEKRKFWETLFNPNFGLIPTLRAKGIKWVPASNSEITTDDVRDWKQELDIAGVGCREFAIFAGRELFSQFQRMLLAAGVVKLDNSLQPLQDCKWINMEYCGIKVEGLTLHIYDECSFSNGKELGAANYVFPTSAIVVPMCARPTCQRSNGRQEAGSQDAKMLSRVYFKSNETGKVWDNDTDANGVLGPRNTFGAGCEQQEWTIKSKFVNEIHCPNWWGYMGL